MPKLIVFLSTFSLILLYIFIFYIGYLIFWPVKTLEIKKSVLPVITYQVKRGSALIYKVNYCRYDMFGAIVYRTIYGNDNSVFPLAPVNTITFPGCRIEKVYLMIPASLATGTYHVDILIKIQVNLLRQEILRIKTQNFQVIN